MRLDILNRTIPGRHGFDNFGQSYRSAVHWARGTLACSQNICSLLITDTINSVLKTITEMNI